MNANQNALVNEELRVLCDRATEDAVLGACLINQDAFPLARSVVAPGDFYIHRNRWIFETMERLWSKHDPIDVITVAAELGPELLKEIGGNPYLTSLTNAPDSSLNAESYAHVVSNLALRRKILAAGKNMATLAYQGNLSSSDLVSCAHLEVQRAALDIQTGHPQTLSEVLVGVKEQTIARARSGQRPGICTGFPRIDLVLGGGLRPGQLSAVSAYPGGGKSSFLAMVAVHAARACHVRLHSLEMTPDEIANRLLARASGINSQAIETGELSGDAERQRLDAASTRLSALHLVIDDSVPLSVPQLRAICLQTRLDLLIIDGTGLMKSPGDGEYEQQRNLSRDLKNLAREIGIPILISLQFNRRGHEQETPRMHHLRGSGTWEQDSDVILILYPRKEPPRPGGLPYRLEIAKHRNGPTGWVDLTFHPQTTEFVEAG